MNSIVDPKQFFTPRRPSVFVLIDMQQRLHNDDAGADPEFDEAVERCRIALDHARSTAVTVAFVRRLRGTSLPPREWLSGFVPSRRDMLFERHGNTCYASTPFAEMVEAAGREYVMAGLFGETSCVATAIDASARGHRVTFLADASYSHGHRGLAAAEMHHAITCLLDLHVAVDTARAWMERVP